MGFFFIKPLIKPFSLRAMKTLRFWDVPSRSFREMVGLYVAGVHVMDVYR